MAFIKNKGNTCKNIDEAFSLLKVKFIYNFSFHQTRNIYSAKIIYHEEFLHIKPIRMKLWVVFIVA